MHHGFSRHYWIIAGIALTSLVARSFLAARLGLFQDEAIYWWLSQDQGVSFCPQPPAVILLLKWGEFLLGPGTLGVRAGSLFFGTLGIILAAVLGRDLFGRTTSVWSAGLYAACPFIFATSSIATPDALILFLWLLFFWVTWRAFLTDHRGWWVASGVVLALGLYAKYMMALALPVALTCLCCLERGRRLLRRPGPWMAVASGLLLFLMVFIPWEIKHGWPTLTYHLMSRHVWEFKLSSFGPYLFGHMAGISPIMWVGIWVTFWRFRPSLPRISHEKKNVVLGFRSIPYPVLFLSQRLYKTSYDPGTLGSYRLCSRNHCFFSNGFRGRYDR